MFVGMFLWSILLVFLLAPPVRGKALDAYFGIMLILFFLVFTLLFVPYLSLGPELSADTEVRTSVYFVQRLWANVGTLFGLVGPSLVGMIVLATTCKKDASNSSDDAAGGNSTALSPSDSIFAESPAAFDADMTIACDQIEIDGPCTQADIEFQKYFIMGLFFAVAMMAMMSTLLCVVSERPGSQEQAKIPLIPSLLRVFKNRAFRPLLFSWIFDAMALSCLTSLFPYFIYYVVEPEAVGAPLSSDNLIGACFAVLFLTIVIALPIWKLVVKRFGKYRTYIAFNVLNAVTNFGFIFVGKGQWQLLILITAINAIPFGAQFLGDAIIADVIDYDEFLNGKI